MVRMIDLHGLHHRTWAFTLALLLVLAVTVLVYFPGLRGPFVFDDWVNLLQQPELQITSFSFESLIRAMTGNTSGPLGRPIAMLSFALNYYFSEFDSFGYKVTNLAIHGVCGVLVLLLTHRLLTRLQIYTGRILFDTPGLRWLSLAVASLWLLHPLNVTSVLYTVQRMNSLATLFMLAGLLLYIYGREHVLTGQRRGLFICTLSIPVFTLFAIFSKETGVLLPVYAILIELVFYRLAAAPEIAKPFRMLWWALIAAPVVLGLTIIAFDPYRWLSLNSYYFYDFTLGERLLTETRVLWFYLRLILLPDFREMGLYHDDIAISRSLLDPWTTLPAVLGIAGLLIGGVALRRRQPLLAFGMLWFLAGHSLESTVVPLEIAHDHRNYLPLWGILLATAWYIARHYEGLTTRPVLRPVILGSLVIMMGLITYAQANFWKSEWSLFNHDVLNHPRSAKTRTSLGLALHEHRQDQLAHEQLVIAANLRPVDTSTIVRLAHHHYLWKKIIPNDLLAEMELRLMTYPSHPVTLWIYEPLIRVTRPDRRLQNRIIDIYERLIARPDARLPAVWRAKANYILGLEYYFRGDYLKAQSRLDQALALNNADPMFSLLAGEIHMKYKDAAKAREHIRQFDKLNAKFLPPDIEKRAAIVRQWAETP